MNSQTTTIDAPARASRTSKPTKNTSTNQSRSNGKNAGQATTSARSRTLTASEQEPGNRATRALLSEHTSRREVVFIFDQQSAQEVLLAGSFTNWNEAPIRMRRDGNGAWQTRVLLAPGRYFYKYLVDGQWHTDPEAPEDCPNPFGTTDSVKEIT